MAEPAEIHPQWRFGEDLKQELIDVFDVPHWPENWDENPMVHNFGMIKMQRIYFKKDKRAASAAYNVMQTCICLCSLSTSKPAKRSMHDTIIGRYVTSRRDKERCQRVAKKQGS